MLAMFKDVEYGQYHVNLVGKQEWARIDGGSKSQDVKVILSAHGAIECFRQRSDIIWLLCGPSAAVLTRIPEKTLLGRPPWNPRKTCSCPGHGVI